jgi:hypothetical protein
VSDACVEGSWGEWGSGGLLERVYGLTCSAASQRDQGSQRVYVTTPDHHGGAVEPIIRGSTAIRSRRIHSSSLSSGGGL